MIEKTKYVRSLSLMRAYRQIECQHCGIDDGSVCGAHSNQSKHNKGLGIKASDDACASLCHACHYELDQGKELTRQQRIDMWERAHRKTRAALKERGLWEFDGEEQ